MFLRDIVLGFLLLSFFPSAYAQKRNIPDIWTIQIIPADHYQSTLTPTIVGGPGDPTIEVIYDPTRAPVKVNTFVCTPGNSGNANVFALQITNTDPYAPRPDPRLQPMEWISFANIFMAEDSRRYYYAARPPTDRLTWLGPIPLDSLPGTSEEHYLWPWKDDPTQAYSFPSQQVHAAFMNEGPHPRQFYEAVHLQVSFSGISFLEMNLQETRSVSAKFGIAIWSKRDCGAPRNTGIGMHLGEIPEPQMYPAYISRTAVHQWKMELNQPVLLYESGYGNQPSPATEEKSAGCSLYLSGGQWTTPIRFSMLFTRRFE